MKKGFTLLEVIVAIFLITVGISASLLLITRTIGQMAISESQLIAAYLSQEGIEIVRNIRDTNWIEQTDPANTPPNEPWDNGLLGCLPPTGCEADYTVTTQRDPTLGAFAGNFLKIDGSGFYNYTCCDPPTKFKRKITITQPDPNILNVTVLVTWIEKGKTYSHTAQENLYNWR